MIKKPRCMVNILSQNGQNPNGRTHGRTNGETLGPEPVPPTRAQEQNMRLSVVGVRCPLPPHSNHMNPFCFPRGNKRCHGAGKKTGARFWGIRFFPAEAGLSQARPWPPGGTHFFSPPRAGLRMPVGLPLILTKIPTFPQCFQGFLNFLTPWEFSF